MGIDPGVPRRTSSTASDRPTARRTRAHGGLGHRARHRPPHRRAARRLDRRRERRTGSRLHVHDRPAGGGARACGCRAEAPRVAASHRLVRPLRLPARGRARARRRGSVGHARPARGDPRVRRLPRRRRRLGGGGGRGVRHLPTRRPAQRHRHARRGRLFAAPQDPAEAPRGGREGAGHRHLRVRPRGGQDPVARRRFPDAPRQAVRTLGGPGGRRPDGPPPADRRAARGGESAGRGTGAPRTCSSSRTTRI